MRLKVLNLTAGSPFSDAEYKEYNSLIKRIRAMESLLERKPASEEMEGYSLEQFQAVDAL
jgi:hypothetical protein